MEFWAIIGTLGGGDFFQVGLEDSLYKKKDDSNFISFNFSHLVPYTNNFLVACICILVFHGLYSLPPSTNIFFVGAKTFSVKNRGVRRGGGVHLTTKSVMRDKSNVT